MRLNSEESQGPVLSSPAWETHLCYGQGTDGGGGDDGGDGDLLIIL